MTNCLLIDDDVDDQEIFRMCLKKINDPINLLTMNDGVQALSHITANNDYTPDYIFIDVNMPKMNGLECLQHLKNIERLSDSKIYMYSTTSAKPSVDESIRLGANGFIIKPSKTSELIDQLSKIFKSFPK